MTSPDLDRTPHDEYLICKERGHGRTTMILPMGDFEDWKVCGYCGTHYRTVETPEESNIPRPAEAGQGSVSD